MNKIIAIYPGRFQPFGKHHAASFMWLQNKFGKENTYIVTSNKTDDKSPFNFAEKKAIIELYGIDPSHIIEVKNPYNPVELYGQFDGNTTDAVIMVGDKDMGDDPRFKIGPKKDGSPSFFQDYKSNETNMQPLSKHGYLINAPHISINIPGYGEMSGTEIRQVLGDATKTREEKTQLFKDIFGWYSDKMANYIFDKLENKMAEAFSKDWWLEELLKEEDPCWDGYKQIGMKKKGKKQVPNCVPVNEGGNVFGTTNPIAKSDIEPTLEVFSDRLAKLFPAKAASFKQFEKLGSVGKKELSGDIDLAYDVKNFFPDGKTPDLKGWGLDENKYNELVAGFTKRAKNASPEKINLRAIIQLVGDKINNAYDDIEVDTKGSGSGALFCSIQQYDINKKPLPKYVQADVNIGNLDWLTFSYYSNTYSGNVKGLHRTQLMLSLFANKNYTFGHGTGVVDKETGKQVASNSQEAIDLLSRLYGFNLTRDILNDYFKLEEFLKANLSQEEYNAIMDRYLKILDSTRTDIPDNLQDYWIANQARLGLKGKFLPDDSKLLSYQTLTESGSIGADRIPSMAVKATVDSFVNKVLKPYPLYKGYKITGSYNIIPKDEDGNVVGGQEKKEGHGDIDLVIELTGDKADTKQIKADFATYLKSLPDDVIVPFRSGRHVGKKTAGTGDIVITQYPIEGYPDLTVQIDNMIVVSPEELTYRSTFLDIPGERQALLIGLAKAMCIEENPYDIFKRLNIKNIPTLEDNQEFEFVLSPKGLTLRVVTLDGFKELNRTDIWSSFNWSDVEKLFQNYDINGSFEELLYDIVRKVKNTRSKNRIKGTFKSMLVINSGEAGTPKGNAKLRALDKVADVL